MPELVAAFARRHPGVRPDVLITDSAAVEDEARAHRWAVGFVGVGQPPVRHFATRGEVGLVELAG